MKYHVYAVVYDPAGRFLLPTKNDFGYFFHCPSSDDGVIYPGGVRLTNGGGDYALPGGGQLPDEGNNCGARREFLEETGIRIPGLARFDSRTWQHSHQHTYTGCYYGVEPDMFDHLKGTVDAALDQGKDAQEGVRQGDIKEYLAIYSTYPLAPADNELDRCEAWNVLEDSDWNKIRAWQGDPVKGWYYVILRYLRLSLGGLP